MSIDGRRMPRPAPAEPWRPAALALLAPCGFCWAKPGTSCTSTGQHYARYLRIYRRGILDAAGLATVTKAAENATADTIVPHALMPR